MKSAGLFLLLIFCVTVTFASNDSEILKFKGKLGFANEEDSIIEHKFLEDGKKLLIIGQKNLQLWDVENAKLISSAPHQIPQFAPKGITNILLLGLPQIFSWQPYIIDPQGKWIITIEKTNDKNIKSAIVRDLQTVKQIAVLDLPNISTDYVDYDVRKGEILTYGKEDKNASFANWNRENFKLERVISINDYKWHQLIKNDEKMLVGAGDTKIAWNGLGSKEGNNLSLRDVKTGAVEKEYTAKNLIPETTYQETMVSEDEKLLISKRNDRIFVWEIDGDGQPKFEVSQPNPKGSFSFKRIIDKKFIVVKIDGNLRVYDIAGNGTPKFEAVQQNPKEDLDFNGLIGENLMVVRADGKIRVYDAQNGKTPKFEIVSDNPKDSAEYQGSTGDGKYMIVRDDRKVSVFETAGSGKPVYEIVRQSEKERFPTIKIFNDKKLLAIARINRSEKKEPKTEFYDLATGKLSFDAAFEINYDVKYTPDDKYLYQTRIGSFDVWNLADKKLYSIRLDTQTDSTYDSVTKQTTEGETYNDEYVDFSPDYRYILRHGDAVTAVFDTATGKQLQTLFDPDKVKYDKQNNIKKSGLGDGNWIGDGKYVYALGTVSFFGSARTINFWEVKK